MAAVASPMTTRQFDDQNIRWRELEGFKHMMVSIFFVDEVRNRVELLIKFDPNEKVLLHRHLADTNTFVVEGEHVIYEPDGSVREVRPVASIPSARGGMPMMKAAVPTAACCTTACAARATPCSICSTPI